jgi:hypothetical protein
MTSLMRSHSVTLSPFSTISPSWVANTTFITFFWAAIQSVWSCA